MADALLARLTRQTTLAALDTSTKVKKYRDGKQYAGELKAGDNVPHGFGELRRATGQIEYEGDFWDGLMQGNGTYHFEDGSSWEGTFRHNELHGFGRLQAAQGGKPREVFFWGGRRVCDAAELEDARISVAERGSWRSASVEGRRERRGGRKAHFLLRFDDRPDEPPAWRDLSVTQFRVLRGAGRYHPHG